MSQRPEPHCQLCEWVIDHADEIQGDGVDLDGTLITSETEVVCYHGAVSFLAATLKGDTAHHFAHRDEGGGAVPTLITTVFGWWGFP
jgi:hypothetical protein